MAFSLRRVCSCSHARDSHQHYRRGTDCAACSCTAYRGGFVVTLALRTGSAPVPQVVLPDRVEEVAGPWLRPTHTAGTGGRPALAGDVVRARVVTPRQDAPQRADVRT